MDIYSKNIKNKTTPISSNPDNNNPAVDQQRAIKKPACLTLITPRKGPTATNYEIDPISEKEESNMSDSPHNVNEEKKNTKDYLIKLRVQRLQKSKLNMEKKNLENQSKDARAVKILSKESC